MRRFRFRSEFTLSACFRRASLAAQTKVFTLNEAKYLNNYPCPLKRANLDFPKRLLR
jgi:hypothetical protein